MKTKYRYMLDSSSNKFICPRCGQKRFVRFVDTLKGGYIDEKFGRCDREDSCGYFLLPQSKPAYRRGRRFIRSPVDKPSKPIIYIPKNVLMETLCDYQENGFVQNLLTNVPFPFNVGDVERVIAQYYIGTIDLGAGRRRGSHRGYATTFPFINKENRIRAIQAKLFDDKNHTTSTNFVHKILENRNIRDGKSVPEWIKRYNENESKVSCLFGAHLLDLYPRNPIALVEAPKTAIYGTLYHGFPDDETKPLWLAVYNKSSLTLEKCKDLEGRRVILFPDLSKDGATYREWSAKAEMLERKLRQTRFIVSDLLENNASQQERIKGLDLADFLIKQNWKHFRV